MPATERTLMSSTHPRSSRLVNELFPFAFLSIGAAAATALIASLAEAGALWLIVSSTVSLLDESANSSTASLPLVGPIRLSPTEKLSCAAVLMLLGLCGHYLNARRLGHLEAKAIHEARRKLLTAFSRASWSRQALLREGSLQEAATSLSYYSAALVTSIAYGSAAATSIVALLGTSILIDPVATGAVALLGSGSFLLLQPLTRATERRAGSFARGNSHFAEETSSWVSSALELRIFGVEDSARSRLEQLSEDTSRSLARARVASQFGAALYRSLAVLLLIVAVATIRLVGEVDLASIGAVLLIATRCLSYASQLQASVQRRAECSPSLRLLHDQLVSLNDAAESRGNVTLHTLGRVDLKDVTYEYAEDRRGVTALTLTLEPKEALGVVGPSGSGKSTLVQLLLRLRTPTSGVITVNGVPYETISPACWHKLVAVVPQEPLLFEGTIRENIRFMRSDISDSDILSAATSAHVLAEIEQFADGIDTTLGPRGSGLSGGQKQRVAIARALAGRPQLLILDEPTSALDSTAEQQVSTTIAALKGTLTMMVVTHRSAALAACDRMATLNDGRLTQLESLDKNMFRLAEK